MPQASASREEANLAVWLVDTGIVKSRREAREFISNGAITLNGTKVTDVEAVITPQDAIGGKYVVVRRGKKNYTLVTYQD